MLKAWLWFVAMIVGVWAQAAEIVSAPKIPIKAWLPEVVEGKRYPVVVFSHGLGGSPGAYNYFGEGLAKAGYVVVGVEHADALLGKDLTEEKMMDAGTVRSRLKKIKNLKEKINEDLENSPALGRPQDWTDASQKNRREDMEYMLYYISVTQPYKNLCDFEKIGAAGHSMGGYTVLGMAGAWESWYDPRIKAVVAMSPYSQPFLYSGGLKNLAAPVMYMGGTRDVGVTPYIKKNEGAYTHSPSPKYFVNIAGAQHFTFSVRGTDKKKQAIILDYTIAFFDKYLKGEKGELLEASPLKGVAEYWKE